MLTIDDPLLVLVGVPLMALVCAAMSRLLPLLEEETSAHRASLPLDGLRGLLASSVFFHHAYLTFVFYRTGNWSTPASNFYSQLGPTAVTMFFFISGYLFWGKMLKDPSSIRAVRLWPNRIRRILPAYWAAILLAFLVTVVMTKFELRESVRRLMEHAGQWILVGFPCLPDLNGLAQERVTGGVYWTLRTEMIFYLVLPALVWFRKLPRLLLLFFAMGIVDYVLTRFPAQSGPLGCSVDVVQRFTLAMATSFAVGMLAVYPRWNERLLNWLRSSWITCACLILLTIQFTWIPADYTWYEPILLAPVFIAVAAGNSCFGVLTSRPMRSLGQISYSVYIFHGVLLYVLSTLLNQHMPIASMTPLKYWAAVIGISIIVVAFSMLTYCFIERPFLPKRARLQPVVPIRMQTSRAGHLPSP